MASLVVPATALSNLRSLENGLSRPSTLSVSSSVPVFSRTSRSSLSIHACHEGVGNSAFEGEVGFSRRDVIVTGMTALMTAGAALPALADFDEDYKKETQAVIDQVKGTLALDKSDPAKPDAVTSLRQTSNDWVAKYRRVKQVAGRPSFSNMYSVLNAISGHYISFGPTYPIPVKRKDRILEEVQDAEKALNRGR